MYFRNVLRIDSDRLRLIAFLKEFRRLAADLLGEPQRVIPELKFISEAAHAQVRLAWKREIIPRFPGIAQSIRMTSHRCLAAVGLTSESLTAKLMIIKEWGLG